MGFAFALRLLYVLIFYVLGKMVFEKWTYREYRNNKFVVKLKTDIYRAEVMSINDSI